MSATFSEMSQILRWMGRWRERYEKKQAEKMFIMEASCWADGFHYKILSALLFV